MTRRRAIHLDGIGHSAPIPMAAMINGILFSSGIGGADPLTGVPPDDGTAQVGFMFANIDAVLEQAGLGQDDLLKLDIAIEDNQLRAEVNRHWLEWFPDEDDRPARHISVHALPGRLLAQAQIVAVRGDTDA